MKSKQKAYLTEYDTTRGAYSSFVFAKSLAEAKRYCQYRGIGERVLGVFDMVRTKTPDAVTEFEKLPFKDQIHFLVYTGYIAISGSFPDKTKKKVNGMNTLWKYKNSQIFGDFGIVHSFCHSDKPKKERLEDARKLINVVFNYNSPKP